MPVDDSKTEAEIVAEMESMYDHSVDPTKWTILRLDGKNFGSVTRYLDKPFDLGFIGAMDRLARHLADLVSANLYFTQSDEITLVIPPPDKGEIVFGGRVMKLCSIVAAEASARMTLVDLPIEKPATFDCRVFSAESEAHSRMAVSARRMSCRSNALQSYARSRFSHSKLDGKHFGDMVKMLLDVGFDWYDNPTAPEKVGHMAVKSKTFCRLTPDEIESLPEKHHARRNPELMFERSKWVARKMSVLDRLREENEDER